MAVEIRVNPNYIGLQGESDCVYRWRWEVDGALVRETIGKAPDTSPLTIASGAPGTATTYNIQLIVKNNITGLTVNSSSIKQVTVQPSICAGVCN